jgi:hypothetical protein
MNKNLSAHEQNIQPTKREGRDHVNDPTGIARQRARNCWAIRD